MYLYIIIYIYIYIYMYVHFAGQTSLVEMLNSKQENRKSFIDADGIHKYLILKSCVHYFHKHLHYLIFIS